MTTPAPPQQTPPVQPPPPPDSDLDSTLFATAIAGALLTAVPVAGVIAALKVRFALTSAAWTALTAVLGDVMQHPSPPPVTGVTGVASAQTARQNLARRAQFVVAASKRVKADLVDWRAKHTGPPPVPPEPSPGPAAGQTADLNLLRRAQFAKAKRARLAADIAGGTDGDAGPMAALQAGLARERGYYAQHLAAMQNRSDSAGKTDAAAAKYGDLLGWASVRDSRTSPECRAAHGKNYRASRMPDISYPGSTHPHCRCVPVAPWPGAPLLPSRGRAAA